MGLDDLKVLTLRLLEEGAALRKEIARLKGRKSRPKLRPSGMYKAADPKPEDDQARRNRQHGGANWLAITEERMLPVPVPPGSWFKGYEISPRPGVGDPVNDDPLSPGALSENGRTTPCGAPASRG